MINKYQSNNNESNQIKYLSPLWGIYGYSYGLFPYNNAPGTGQTAKHNPHPVQSWVIVGLWSLSKVIAWYPESRQVI